MQRILILAVFLFLGFAAGAQSHFGIRSGLLYGGPVPSESDPDSSMGTPFAGPSFGIWRDWHISKRWTLRNEIGYALKGADYQQILRNDTNVTIELIPNVVDTLPSYYIADVNGKMRLHYLELPIFAQYQVFKRCWINFGFNPAFLLGGYDRGTAKVQIGNGSLFEDETEDFENKAEIHRFDLGLMAGATYTFDFGLQIEIRGQRSIRDLYQKGFLAKQGLEGVKMYHSQGYLGLGYRF